MDLALSPNGQFVYVKNMSSLLVIDAASWKLLQTLNYPASGASMHGIAVSADNSHVYVTGAGNELYEWALATNGLATFSRTMSLPAGSDPCGLALSADGSKAYVCLGTKNTLGVVDLAAGKERWNGRRSTGDGYRLRLSQISKIQAFQIETVSTVIGFS